MLKRPEMSIMVERLEQALIPLVAEFVQDTGFLPVIRAIPHENEETAFSFSVQVTSLEAPPRRLKRSER